MPLAAAFVVIAAIWPIKPWLDRFLTPGLSYVATMLVLAVVVTGFTVAVYFSTAQVVSAFERSWDRLDVLYRHVSDWTASWGWPLDGEEGYLRLVGVARALLQNIYTILGYLGFTALLVVFGLPEVPALRLKLRETFTRDEQQEVLASIEAIAEKIRQYLGISTFTSLLTGVATGLYALAVGLDLALVWGVLNFLLIHPGGRQPRRHRAADPVRVRAVPDQDSPRYRVPRIGRNPARDQQRRLPNAPGTQPGALAAGHHRSIIVLELGVGHRRSRARRSADRRDRYHLRRLPVDAVVRTAPLGAATARMTAASSRTPGIHDEQGDPFVRPATSHQGRAAIRHRIRTRG